MSSPHPSRPSLRVAQLCLVSATVVATYLIWVSLTGSAVAGCGPDSGCDQVLHSRWSRWLGIPVSLLAWPLYVGLFVGALRLTAEPQNERVRSHLAIGSFLLIGAALWFGIIQAFILHHFCPWCLTAHALGLVGGCALLGALRSSAPEFPATPTKRLKTATPPAKLNWRAAVLIALTALAALIAGQALYHPAEFVVQSAPTNTVVASGATSRIPASAVVATNVVVKPKRLFPLYDGKFNFDLDEIPILGRKDAPHFLVSLFDYSCKHCRLMHHVLSRAQQTFPNDLGIISLPMPLDSRCNHLVKKVHPDHADACEYARIGLALWRINPNIHLLYENWFFQALPPQPPPALVMAQQKAAELVGTNALAQALRDPWIEQRLQEDIAIYELSYNSGQGSMPQIVFGKQVAVGTLKSDDVFRLLDETFGLKRPTAPAVRPPGPWRPE